MDKLEGFLVDNINIISIHNYEEVRNIIMKQNLMFEQKVYKNEMVREWAEMMLEERAKNSAKITIEDMITAVKNYNGLTYEQVMEETIYQLSDAFLKMAYVILWPLIFLSGIALDNTMVYGEIFHMDLPLWQFWNFCKNFAKFEL